MGCVTAYNENLYFKHSSDDITFMNQSTRRQMIQRGLAVMSAGTFAALSGCETIQSASRVPDTPWPDLNAPPTAKHRVPTRTNKPATVKATGAGGPGNPIPRSKWTSARPKLSSINPMPMPIRKITIHHDGLPSHITTNSYSRLNTIRNGHVNARGWADIGYHYIIDREGRVWEGRPIQYQGAHVKNDNEHNVGVLCLGNFEIHTPTSAQLNTLAGHVSYLRKKYRLSERSIYTHKEINPTQCPGRNLHPRVLSMRRAHAFV